MPALFLLINIIFSITMYNVFNLIWRIFMKNISRILMLFLALSLCVIPVKDLYAGGFSFGSVYTFPETDTTPVDEEEDYEFDDSDYDDDSSDEYEQGNKRSNY